MLDPLIGKTIALGLGLLFALAAAHKFSTMESFAGVLADYQLLPIALVVPATWIVAILELALSLGWFIAPQFAAVPIFSSALLAIYTAAMGINLARGRIHIGCGCSFAGKDESDQQLSVGLLGRNAILITLALSATLPVTDRNLGLGDYLVVAAALFAGTLLYAASNQLLGNGAAIGVWRNGRE